MNSVVASGSRDAHAPSRSPERGNTFGAPSACCADQFAVEYSDEKLRTVVAHCGSGGGLTSTSKGCATRGRAGHAGAGLSARYAATPTATNVTNELTTNAMHIARD